MECRILPTMDEVNMVIQRAGSNKHEIVYAIQVLRNHLRKARFLLAHIKFPCIRKGKLQLHSREHGNKALNLLKEEVAQSFKLGICVKKEGKTPVDRLDVWIKEEYFSLASKISRRSHPPGTNLLSCPCSSYKEDGMVLCDSCYQWYHTSCDDNPVEDVKLPWFCSKCSNDPSNLLSSDFIPPESVPYRPESTALNEVKQLIVGKTKVTLKMSGSYLQMCYDCHKLCLVKERCKGDKIWKCDDCLNEGAIPPCHTPVPIETPKTTKIPKISTSTEVPIPEIPIPETPASPEIPEISTPTQVPIPEIPIPEISTPSLNGDGKKRDVSTNPSPVSKRITVSSEKICGNFTRGDLTNSDISIYDDIIFKVCKKFMENEPTDIKFRYPLGKPRDWIFDEGTKPHIAEILFSSTREHFVFVYANEKDGVVIVDSLSDKTIDHPIPMLAQVFIAETCKAYARQSSNGNFFIPIRYQHCTQQPNYHDCGAFAVANMKCYVSGNKMFKQLKAKDVRSWFGPFYEYIVDENSNSEDPPLPITATKRNLRATFYPTTKKIMLCPLCMGPFFEDNSKLFDMAQHPDLSSWYKYFAIKCQDCEECGARWTVLFAEAAEQNLINDEDLDLFKS